MKKILLSAALLLVAGLFSQAQNIVIDSLEFDSALSSSPEDLLRGKISGVRVSLSDGSINGAVNTAIRGLQSIHSDSAPLWIVDGAILNGVIDQSSNAFWQSEFAENDYAKPLNRLFSINPYDIESIEIIKDISATAIYGSLGANGVIIIKTKLPSEEGRTIKLASNLGYGSGQLSQNHYVSFNSRTGRNSFNMSASFKNMKGSMKRSGNLTGGLRLNFDSKANKNIWFGLSSSIMKGRLDAQSSTAWYGHESASIKQQLTGDYSGYVQDYDDFTEETRTIDNVYLQINFLDNLTWRTDAGVDFIGSDRYIWYGKGTTFGLLYNGAAALMSNNLLRYNVNSALNYSFFFCGNNKISAQAVFNMNGNNDKNNTMNGWNFFTHELRSKGFNFNGGKASTRYFSRSLNNLGFFGSLAYEYSDIVKADFSLRADKTGRYENSYTLYPAANIAFDIKNAFISDSRAVSRLKLKAGIGKAGKAVFAPYELLEAFVPGIDLGTVQEGSEILYEGFNKFVTREYNMTIETGFLKGRISFDATWYDRKVSESFNASLFGAQKGLQQRWFKKSTGDVLFVSNTGLAGRGLEFDLTAIPIHNGDWKWTLSANAAFQSVQVTSIDYASTFGPSVGSGLVANANGIGYQPGSICGYRTDANGNAIDFTGDGKIGPEDRVILGGTSPVSFGGLSTTLSFRNFILDIDTDFSVGQNILNMNRMIKDGAAQVSDKYVERGDFFRLSRATLAYRIPVRVSWISKFEVNLSGGNLLVLTKYLGQNPDVDSFSASPYCKGLDYGSVPLARTIMAGINISF